MVISGLTPQVVTETLYALRCQVSPFLPTELWIATTKAGREMVEQHLLSSGENQVARLVDEYGPWEMDFDDRHVLHLPDSEDAHEDKAFLDFGNLITARLAAWTDDPASAIHLSLAGGRKTMSYLAGHALSFLGRPQDRLSHVIVDAPFDRLPCFFYPPRGSTPVSLRSIDGCEQVVDLSRANVQLADVPFLRLRSVLPPVLVEQATSLAFSELIDRAQRSLDPAVVEFDTYELRLTCGGIPVQLEEENFAFYLALAHESRRDIGIFPRSERDNDINHYLDMYRLVLPGATELHRIGHEHEKIKRKHREWFLIGQGAIPLGIAETPKEKHRNELWKKRAAEMSEMASRTNAAIDKALGPYLAPRYRVVGDPPKKAKRYLLPRDLTVKPFVERPRREI